jgi:hypothetical protein
MNQRTVDIEVVNWSVRRCKGQITESEVRRAAKKLGLEVIASWPRREIHLGLASNPPTIVEIESNSSRSIGLLLPKTLLSLSCDQAAELMEALAECIRWKREH